MRIEPVADDSHVLVPIFPAVRFPFLDDQPGLDARGLQLVKNDLRLLNRDQFVGIAMNDQRGRIVGTGVGDRADLVADFEIFADIMDGDEVVEPFVELVSAISPGLP